MHLQGHMRPGRKPNHEYARQARTERRCRAEGWFPVVPAVWQLVISKNLSLYGTGISVRSFYTILLMVFNVSPSRKRDDYTIEH